MSEISRVYVGGSRGVGKSTLTRAACKGLDVPLFAGSQIAMDAVNSTLNLGLTQSVELEGTADGELTDKIVLDACRRLYTDNPRMVLDSHFSYWDDRSDASAFGGFVLVTATPEMVRSYIAADPTGKVRNRDLDSIRRDIDREAELAATISQREGLPLSVITNLAGEGGSAHPDVVGQLACVLRGHLLG